MSQLVLNNSANGLKGQYQPDILVTNNNSIREMQQPEKVILVYTTYQVIMGEKCVSNGERQCPWDRFEKTNDMKRFAESNLAIFNGGFIPRGDELKSLLKNRPSSQRWVYHSWECPMYVMNTSPFNGLFNLTWTYRTDADISQPFGNYEPLSQEEIKKNEMAGVTDYTQGKTELVAWMVSNCGPQLRLNFVRELKKFIKVDVFGKCSSVFGESNSCPKGNTSECVRKYKFYLAFENWLCEDYITEKYWGNLGKSYCLKRCCFRRCSVFPAPALSAESTNIRKQYQLQCCFGEFGINYTSLVDLLGATLMKNVNKVLCSPSHPNCFRA